MEISKTENQNDFTFKMMENLLSEVMPTSSLNLMSTSSGNETPEETDKKLKAFNDKIKMIPASILLPPEVNQEVLKTIYSGLFGEKEIEIQYHKAGWEKPSQYILSPLGIVFKENTVYLVCRFKGQDIVKHLVLHRIKEAKLVDETFSPSEAFDLEEHIRNGEMNYILNKEPVTLKLLFDKNAGEFLREIPLSKNQQLTELEGGKLLLQAVVTDSLQLRLWILTHGDRVKVLEPEYLKKEFKKITINLVKKYLNDM